MQLHLKVIFLILSILFLNGALGLKIEEECDLHPLSDGDWMLCYHEAAVSLAIVCPKLEGACIANPTDPACICTNSGGHDPAYICGRIIEVSNDAAARGKNILHIAESQRNYCLMDVAKYRRDASYCYSISETSPGILFGQEISQDICKKTVSRLNYANPTNYLQSQNSICMIVFAFPALFILIIKRK